MDVGLLLPHFGGHASLEGLASVAERAATVGFDSVWARDSLLYRPLVVEERDWTFLDPFVTLAVAGTVTDLTLGTGVAAPYRHPVHLARLYASLSAVSGSQVIAGLGLGGTRAEFELTGTPFDDRPRVHRETVAALGRLWTGEPTSYDGEVYAFDDVRIQPAPRDAIPVWSGGSSPAAVRRAARYCEGWLPGRINFATLELAVRRLRERAADRGRDPPSVGAMPLVSVADDRETALARVNVTGLLAEIRERFDYWERPASGGFESADDLGGVLAAGTPADVREQVAAFDRLGVDHLVFDLRFQFGDVDRALSLLGEGVLAHL